MPRRARLEIPEIPMHITQRGVNRGAIFIDDDDREHYLALYQNGVQATAHGIPAGPANLGRRPTDLSPRFRTPASPSALRGSLAGWSFDDRKQ